MSNVRLGRIRPHAVVRTHPRFVHVVHEDGPPTVLPKLSAHYDRSRDLAPPPPAVDYSPKAAASLSRVYLNDREGDCVIAGKYHLLGVWTANESGAAAVATDDEVQQTYQTVCGPGDNGCVITDVLDHFREEGLVAGGRAYKIGGYVAVDNTDRNEVEVAVDVFGGLTIGVNLTDDCTDAGPGVAWNFAGSVVGGHDVTVYGYDAKGVYVSTWGKVGTLIPWAVFTRKVEGEQPGVEECYVSLSPDWYAKGDLAPNGIDAETLRADLAEIGGGDVPPGPEPGPAPPAPPNPPPPAPAPAPEYAVTLTGELPAGLFGRTATVTLTGTATPTAPAHTPATLGFGILGLILAWAEAHPDQVAALLGLLESLLGVNATAADPA